MAKLITIMDIISPGAATPYIVCAASKMMPKVGLKLTFFDIVLEANGFMLSSVILPAIMY